MVFAHQNMLKTIGRTGVTRGQADPRLVSLAGNQEDETEVGHTGRTIEAEPLKRRRVATREGGTAVGREGVTHWWRV